jgi:predicted SAM-dependent methyltransferase
MALVDTAIKRLQWGCGPKVAAGWVNSDRRVAPGIDLSCDIRAGLPVPADEFDYVVSMHALQEIPYRELDGVLRELRRVLKPGGILRLGLPDLDRAIDAYVRGDADYFHIKDDEVKSLAGKLSVQMTWYGASRSLLTFDFLAELCLKAGFARVCRCEFRQTASLHPDIVSLDNRRRETFFLEAVK